eukprot:187865-Prymnesium_polylepis.1
MTVGWMPCGRRRTNKPLNARDAHSRAVGARAFAHLWARKACYSLWTRAACSAARHVGCKLHPSG